MCSRVEGLPGNLPQLCQRHRQGGWKLLRDQHSGLHDAEASTPAVLFSRQYTTVTPPHKTARQGTEQIRLTVHIEMAIANCSYGADR